MLHIKSYVFWVEDFEYDTFGNVRQRSVMGPSKNCYFGPSKVRGRPIKLKKNA